MYSEQIYERLAPALSIFERKQPRKDLEQEREAHPYDAIVVGAGRLGGDVVRGLLARGAVLLVIDYDPQALRKIAGPHVDTLYGDVAEPEFAASLPFHETKTVICAVPDPTTNIVLLQTLQRLNFDGEACLTAMDQRTSDLLSSHPRVTLIRPFNMAAQSIVSNLTIPVLADRFDQPNEPV